MKKSKYSNSQGAAYFAVNFIGWSIGKTPWKALAGLELNMSGKRVTVNSKPFSEQTEGVNLYYLPDESLFKGTNYYAPISVDDKPYGIPLYVGLSEHNEKIIKESLIIYSVSSDGDSEEAISTYEDVARTCNLKD